MRYWAWRDRIREAWIDLPPGVRKRFTVPVIIGFKFFIVGYPAIDLDNLIKGVKDGLVRAGVLLGDTIQHIPKYDNAEAISLCPYCPKKGKKKTCGAVKKCEKGFAEITINEYERS